MVHPGWFAGDGYGIQPRKGDPSDGAGGPVRA